MAEDIPACTLVTAVDRSHLEELRWTWPTWVFHKPQILQWPLLIIVDGDLDLDNWRTLLSFVEHPNLRIVPWRQDGVEQREKMISSLVRVPSVEVTTPWYLKLDTDAIATSDAPWPCADWFIADDSGEEPVFVSPPWSYTKPAHLIDTLESWGDQPGKLNGFGRLNLPTEQGMQRVSHRRIISWCFFARTEWTRQMSALAPDRLPVASQDTYLWYCAARRKDFYRTVRMSAHGWAHVHGIRRIRRNAKASLAGMLQTAPAAVDVATSSPGEELIRILRANLQQVTRGAEIGVLCGTTSRQLLTAFPGMFLSMIDTWSVPHPSSTYVQSGDSAARLHWSHQLANEQIAYEQTMFAKNRRVLVRGESAIAGQAVAEGSLDFAFLDADHTFPAVQLDIETWWPKIKQGGLLAGHDYDSPRDRRGIWGVRKAVTEFSNRVGVEIHTGKHHIWWAVKP